MSETILNTNALPETLLRLIKTEKVRLKEIDGMIQLMPIREITDCTSGLRGLFTNCPELSVDSFLEKKHRDKELEL